MSKPPMVFDSFAHTGAGRSKRRPPPRPAVDSLPKHECPEPNCGTTRPVGSVDAFRLHSFLGASEGVLWFCSWGCLGRFSALQEVRQ